MTPMVATLVVGLLIGYMGQRSRFCTISGVRDYILLRDSFRLKGLIGLIIGGVIGYTSFKLMGGDIPDFPIGMDIESTGFVIASVIGGIGLGFWSIFAEGCPFRQHVMAAEGRKSALFYLLGFYIGIAFFYLITIKWLELLLIVSG